MAEELINALWTLEGVRVAARTSSFQFKGKAVDVGEIGQRPKVETVLEGSVRKAGNRLRITVQLTTACPPIKVVNARVALPAPGSCESSLIYTWQYSSKYIHHSHGGCGWAGR